MLTVDVGALKANWRQLAARAAPAECGAVVKANAYGTGIENAVPALWDAGCRTFFTGHISEACRVRAVAPSATVYVLNGLPPGAAPAFMTNGVLPVLGSTDEIADWRAGGKGPAAVHIDTGMSRLGLRLDEAAALAAAGGYAGLEISLIISHFISSELTLDPLNDRQAQAFAAVRGLFPGVPASLCNSSGLFLPSAPVHDLVRPGYALYGGNPTPGGANPMRTVMLLEAPVIRVRRVRDGETVGYNAQWRAIGDRTIAVASIGYADGYDRRGSCATGMTGGLARVAGVLCPIVGRISMDLVTIDVTDLPDGTVRRGDLVTLMDEEINADRIAADIGTNGYEVMTSIAERVSRVCRDADHESQESGGHDDPG